MFTIIRWRYSSAPSLRAYFAEVLDRAGTGLADAGWPVHGENSARAARFRRCRIVTDHNA